MIVFSGPDRGPAASQTGAVKYLISKSLYLELYLLMLGDEIFEDELDNLSQIYLAPIVRIYKLKNLKKIFVFLYLVRNV